MTDFKVTVEALKIALSSIVMEGEDVYHSIVFGLNSDDETVRKLVAEEVVRTAIEAALPVMFEEVRVGTGGSKILYRLKEPK